MDRKYTAFISYRHLPLDAAVAKRLHRLIERYRIPKDVRPTPEQTHLGRVFRDRDELPLSSNLTQDIYTALDNSDFLIVVCTPDTPKSMWVQEEIDHFIKVHGRQHVITVLAAGTVEESVPKAITHIYAEDGKTVLQRIEPLCAYLVDTHQWKVLWNLDKEYLRLAAAILSRPYDDLRQRQKQYRLQQMLLLCGIIAAVALGIIILVLGKNAQIEAQNQQILEQNDRIALQNEQIQQQLQQSQLNESQALTLISQTQLESGDRAGAIESALQALPYAENERPYYAPAQLALTNALDVYGSIEPAYRIESMIEQPLEIAYSSRMHISISDDGMYAATIDYHGTVRLFALPSCRELWSFNSNSYQSEVNGENGSGFIRFLPEANALLYAGSSYDYVLSLDDGSVLSCIDYAYPHDTLDVSPNGDQFAGYCEGCVYFQNLDAEAPIISEPVSIYTNPEEIAGAYCADASVFALALFNTANTDLYEYTAAEVTLHLYDTTTGKLINEVLIEHWPEIKAGSLQIHALPDGGLLLSYRYSGVQHCYRISSSGEVLASDSFEEKGLLLDVQIVGEFARYVYKDQYELIADADQYMLIICLADCTVINRLLFPEGRSFCFQNTDGLLILQDTDNIFYRYAPDAAGELVVEEIWSCPVEASKTGWCENNPDIFAVTDDADASRIQIVRRTASSSAQILPMKLSHSYYDYWGNGIYTSPTGRYIFVDDSIGADTVFDTQEKKLVSPGELTHARALGFTADETKLIETDLELYDLLSEDTLTPDGWFDANFEYLDSDIRACISWNDRIAGKSNISTLYWENVLHWWVDGKNYASSQNPYPGRLDTEGDLSLQVGQNGLVLVRPNKIAVEYKDAWPVPYAICDTATGRWQQIPIQTDVPGYAQVCLGREQPWVAMADWDGILRLYDFASDSIIQEISLPSAESVDYMVFLKNDTLLLLVEEGVYFTIIDTSTGTVAAEFTFSKQWLTDTSWNNYTVREDFSGQYLYIGHSLDYAAGLIVDLSSYSVIAEVPGMMAYLPNCNSLLCMDDEETQLFLRPVYTLEELQVLGNAYLSGEM